MAHELAGAVQQAGRIGERRTLEEPHIYMRSEYIDVAERRIAQTCDRTAGVQGLPDFVPAFAHDLKPLKRDGSQFTCMPFHPGIDGGIAFDSTIESQQFRFHRRSHFASDLWLVFLNRINNIPIFTLWITRGSRLLSVSQRLIMDIL
jgi:hypothetical protein